MQKLKEDRYQINVRVSEDILEALDKKRAALLSETGSIPSRSEVIKMALENFLKNKK